MNRNWGQVSGTESLKNALDVTGLVGYIQISRNVSGKHASGAVTPSQSGGDRR